LGFFPVWANGAVFRFRHIIMKNTAAAIRMTRVNAPMSGRVGRIVDSLVVYVDVSEIEEFVEL